MGSSATLAHKNYPITYFHEQLHRWYQQHGRKHLPWRNTKDAYAIYISEIMLQQTQVKTVLERFYFPFLKRFPTLSALAAAPQDEVLQAWQGLGYYNRALNLHAAAKQCLPDLPKHVDELSALPGIGRNTAHAIAAFAYHQPVAVMEANVRRVLARIFALKHPKEPELWQKAQELLDRSAPFNYNQAMMDIGAMICTKRSPLCQECPAQNLCKGKNDPEAYPAALKKKTPPIRKKNIAVFRNHEGYYYASPRTTRFLNGLYHFIESESGTNINFQKESYYVTQGKHLGQIRQQYSHFTLEADIWIFETQYRKTSHWHSYNQLKKLPFSMAESKIIALLTAT